MKGFLLSFYDNVWHLNGFPVVLSAQECLSFQYQRHTTVSKIETYFNIINRKSTVYQET